MGAVDGAFGRSWVSRGVGLAEEASRSTSGRLPMVICKGTSSKTLRGVWEGRQILGTREGSGCKTTSDLDELDIIE